MGEIQTMDYLHVAAKPKFLKVIKDGRINYFMKEYNKRIHASRTLSLSQQHLLSKELRNLLNEEPIKILFSCQVSKINEHGKSQKRDIVITNFGLYNIKPSGFKIQRVISLEEIYALTLSLVPAKKKPETEFVVHVCMNYDYRFRSDHSLEIVRTLESLGKNPKYDLFSKIDKGTEYEKDKEILVEYKKTRQLHNYVVTKSDLSQIIKAKKKLIAKQKKTNPLTKEVNYQVDTKRQTPFGVINYEEDELDDKTLPQVDTEVKRSQEYEEFDDEPFISKSAKSDTSTKPDKQSEKEGKKVQTKEKTKKSLTDDLAEKYGNQPLGGISNLKDLILQAKKNLVKPKKQNFDEESDHEEQNNDKTLHNNFEAILERRYANTSPLDALDQYNTNDDNDGFRISDIDLSEDELI